MHQIQTSRNLRSKLTLNVHGPELDGWKNDSVLVINLSNESKALDPAKNPVCCVGNFACGCCGVAAESPRTDPSTVMEYTSTFAMATIKKTKSEDDGVIG